MSLQAGYLVVIHKQFIPQKYYVPQPLLSVANDGIRLMEISLM
jgi:hypothetical protein